MTSVEAPVHVYTEAHRAESGTRSKSVRFFFSSFFFSSLFFFPFFLSLFLLFLLQRSRSQDREIMENCSEDFPNYSTKAMSSDCVENFYLEDFEEGWNTFRRILVCAIQGKCRANVAWNCGTECPECFIDIIRIGLPSTSSIQSILQRQWSRRTGSRLASIHRTPSMREWNINTENQTAFNECYPLRF